MQQTTKGATRTGHETLVEKEVPLAVNERKSHCATHGRYTSRQLAGFDEAMQRDMPNLQAWSKCPGCEAERRAALEDRAKRISARNEADKAARVMAETNLPPRHRTCTFDNYQANTRDQQRALATVRKWAAERFDEVLALGKVLTLSGATGTGKTHLAAAAINAVLAQGKGAAYMTAGKATRYLKSTYDPDSPITEDEALAHLRRPDLLVLDELGNQHNTADELRVLCAIADARYGYMRPTLWVTNLTAAEVKAWAGDAFYDRLLEQGIVVPFAWSSYRPSTATNPRR